MNRGIITRYGLKISFMCLLPAAIVAMDGQEIMYDTEQEIMADNKQLGSAGTILTRSENQEVPGAIVETVSFESQVNGQSTQKIKRFGTLVRYPKAKSTIIVCHGFMCDRADSSFLRLIFRDVRYKGEPCNVLTFDFRAHGEHVEGQQCTFGRDEKYDVLAAVKFVENHPAINDLDRIGYGFSMGAVAIIEALQMKQDLFKAVVLDSPFDRSDNLLKRILDDVKMSFFGYQFALPGRGILQRYAFHPYVQSMVKVLLKTVAHIDPRHVNIRMCAVNPAESIKSVTVPVAFILCKKDRKVSVEGMKAMFYASPARYKLLWLTHGRHHFDSISNPERYVAYISDFLAQAMDDSLYTTQKELILDDDDTIPQKKNEGTHEK